MTIHQVNIMNLGKYIYIYLLHIKLLLIVVIKSIPLYI